MIDLHIHTYYSDGKFSPAEVIDTAARKGLRALAITDHDNTRGVREALPLAQAAGIELIPGIEFTTRWPGAGLPPGDTDVDLLGYYIDLNNAAFRAFEEATLNDIHARMAACCQRLTEAGYPLEMKDVYVDNVRYGGSMEVIHTLQRMGYAPTWDAALAIFTPVWQAGRETPFTIQSVIQQIHLAGGAAVLAHPSIVRPRGVQLTASWLHKLVDAGLDGIEVYHHRLDKAAREHFLGLARSFSLMVTGGSDMHGWRYGLNEIARDSVGPELLEALKRKRRHS